MKFIVLFLATAALASASILGTKKVHITEDGSILIQGDNGKEVQIKKNGPYGQRIIEIDVTGPNTLAKRIQIDNNNLVSIERGVEYNIPTNDGDSSNQKNKRSSTTEEVLNGIFKHYLGYVNDKYFTDVIAKVQKVLNGDVFEKNLEVSHTQNGDFNLNDKISESENQDENMNQLEKQYNSELNGYGQDSSKYDTEYFLNILFKIFDKEFLRTVLRQEIYNQGSIAQKSIEDLWDAVFSHQGIFDDQLLVRIINDKVLKNYFVEQGFLDKVVLDQILYAYETEGVYDKYLVERLVNTQELKQFFIRHGISLFDILGKTYINQYYGELINGQNMNQQSVLMKIFDRQVLNTILTQQNMYNQEMYGQYSYEKMWDMVFAYKGVFDQKYLLQIINNKVLRNYFVQQGFFDSNVLKQIIEAYKTEGVYDQYLFQRLINTQVLKYFLISHRISVYDILKQTYNKYNSNNFYNKYYGNIVYNKGINGYNMLEKIISQPMYRDIMVQYGIFNENTLNQILYQHYIQGVYDSYLLKQLVNKEALYKILVQYGIVDQTVLREYVDNENLGLNFLYRNNFFQQSSSTIHKQTFDYENLSETRPNTEVYPYGPNYFRNMMYGQKFYDLYHRYNQGYYGQRYSQYPTTVQQY